MKWEPLSDIWDGYVATLAAADEAGQLNDQETAEEILWPPDLYISEAEKDDVRRYISGRMGELEAKIRADRGVDLNNIAVYLFRTLMCGMKWEAERIGR